MSEMQRTVTVQDSEGNDHQFTIQKMPPRQYSRLKDRCTNKDGKLVEENLMTEVIKHMVVDPDLSYDDFTDYRLAEGVVREAIGFQSGRELPRE